MYKRQVNNRELENLRLYSDPHCRVLTEKLAQFYGVQPENVFVSNGSDESLNFFFMAFCDSKKGVAFPEISYGFYEVFAQLYNLNYQKIPLKDDFTPVSYTHLDVYKRQLHFHSAGL